AWVLPPEAFGAAASRAWCAPLSLGCLRGRVSDRAMPAVGVRPVRALYLYDRAASGVRQESCSDYPIPAGVSVPPPPSPPPHPAQPDHRLYNRRKTPTAEGRRQDTGP